MLLFKTPLRVFFPGSYHLGFMFELSYLFVHRVLGLGFLPVSLGFTLMASGVLELWHGFLQGQAFKLLDSQRFLCLRVPISISEMLSFTVPLKSSFKGHVQCSCKGCYQGFCKGCWRDGYRAGTCVAVVVSSEMRSPHA